MGRPLAQRLLAQGETVVDVPAKLAARVRVFDTGNARKTDATDAHAVAMVAVSTPRLNQLAYDEELIALRRVQTVNRLQRLLAELIPGGAKRDLSALQARLLATVKPRTLVGKDDAADSGRRDRRPGSGWTPNSRPSRPNCGPRCRRGART